MLRWLETSESDQRQVARLKPYPGSSHLQWLIPRISPHPLSRNLKKADCRFNTERVMFLPSLSRPTNHRDDKQTRCPTACLIRGNSQSRQQPLAFSSPTSDRPSEFYSNAVDLRLSYRICLSSDLISSSPPQERCEHLCDTFTPRLPSLDAPAAHGVPHHGTRAFQLEHLDLPKLPVRHA